jgi:uncharacterized protein (DUF433 family)
MPLTLQPQIPPLRLDAGGVVRVGDSRVTLDTVIAEYDDGTAPEDIASGYDLDVAHVYGAIAYYLAHRQDVREYIAGRRREADELRRQMEAEGVAPPPGFGDELRARLARRGT